MGDQILYFTQILPNKKPTYWWGTGERLKAVKLKFDQKPQEAAFSAVSSNFEKCRREVADDVISGLAVD